jgi:hypothetical protein
MIDIGPEASLLLDIGQHTITLTAYDGLGNVGEASITVHVLAGSNSNYLPAILK